MKMKTSRQKFTQSRSRYGRSVQVNDKKLSQSFFNNPSRQTNNKFNTISKIQQIDPAYSVNITDDQKIQSLIAKNDRLKAEIRKIQKVLKQSEQLQRVKPQYGIKLPQIRTQVADKQLQNAYKQIKHYQHQIQRLKSLQNQGTYAVRLTKTQRSLKQKQQFKDKLKIQLQKIQKSSKHYTKSLIGDRSKILLQNKSKKINDQLKMYQKKWNQDQRKKNFFLQTQRKKREYILELQKKLWQGGTAKTQIEQLRKIIFQAQTYRKDQSDEQSQEEIEDRTNQSYIALTNELKLLKKVTVTNQKLFQKMQDQKQQYIEKNRKIKINLDQTQKQIQIIENQILFLKKHIDPQKLKPKLNVQGSFNSRVTFNSMSLGSQQNTTIQPYANRNKQILQHHFQVSEIGSISKRSEKFNDRKVLGKLSAKIIGVDLFQNRMQLLGFQFTYHIKQDEKKQGMMMQIKNENQRYFQKKQLYLDGNDYFSSIECFMNQKNMITGIILISKAGQVIKAGNLQGQKGFLQMNTRQYPACVYSCIGKDGIELVGVEKVQPQSF